MESQRLKRLVVAFYSENHRSELLKLEAHGLQKSQQAGVSHDLLIKSGSFSDGFTR